MQVKTALGIILISAAGAVGVFAYVNHRKNIFSAAPANPGTGGNVSNFPSGSFVPGAGTVPTNIRPPTPTPSGVPGTTLTQEQQIAIYGGPAPTTPEPIEMQNTAQVVIQAQNGKTATFVITQRDLDTLTNTIPSTGYVSSVQYVQLPSIDTIPEIMSFIAANVIQAPVIPNLQFDLQAPNGQWMRGVILTQDDWTTFRAIFPTGIGVYSVSDTNAVENTSVLQLQTFINNNQK